MHDVRFERNGVSLSGHPVPLQANHSVLRRNFFYPGRAIGGETKWDGQKDVW